MTDEKEMPDEINILRTHCIFCYKSTSTFCGGWTARTAGCCVGAEYKKVHYVIGLSAHIPCIVQHKGKIKTWYSENDLKKFISKVKK